MSSRLTRLAAVIAGAAALTIVFAIVSSAEKRPTKKPAPANLLTGIPEHRGVLGDPGAPATLTEFVDPQCPICAETSRTVLPALLQKYVRTGKVKLDARVLSFLGPDSVTLAEHAAGARAQDRLWPFLEQVFANQGEENSGYATPAFVGHVAKAAGVDATVPAGADRAVAAATAEAKRLGVTGTPTFVLTKDGKQTIVDPAALADVL